MLTVDRNGPFPAVTPEQPSHAASPFDAIRKVSEDGVEFWSARLLMQVLGYENWQNFARVLLRARTTCEVAGFNPAEHFTRASKQLEKANQHGTYATKLIDWNLDRYACYLTAMCGDAHKPRVAEAKTYFAVRTRQAERAEETAAPAGTTALSVEEALLQSVQLLIDQKRRLHAVEQRQDNVEQRLDCVQGAVGELAGARQRALEFLDTVPTSAVPAPPLSVRDNIRQLVSAFCAATGVSQVTVWGKLYKELYYRCKVNVREYAKRHACDSLLDAAEQMGVLKELYALASDLPDLFRDD